MSETADTPQDPFLAEPWRREGEEPFVRIESVTKRFGDFVAVDHVSLDIYQREFFSLLGGSGCGKSTLLRMLAGLETPTSGRILIAGEDMTNTPAYRRPVHMMFQSYALFPHLTVADNVAFGLRQSGASKGRIRARVQEMLALVQMEDLGERKPDALSGGQKQRVALARALANEPKLVLLDEPLAALDKNLRERTQLELSRIQEQVGITFVMVTHDQEEAINLSTRLAVMNAGRLEQIGTPREVYEFPESIFVADFVGHINLFPATLANTATEGIAEYILDGPKLAARVQTKHSPQRCTLAIRPEKIHISASRPQSDLPVSSNLLQGEVEEITYLGAHALYYIRVADGQSVRVSQPVVTRDARRRWSWGESVWLSWDARSVIVLER